MVLIGASKRYDSIKLLIDSAVSLNLQLELYSIEYDSSEFHPISELATIVEGPLFDDPDFLKTITNLCSQDATTIFIPFMDSAAFAISSHSNMDSTIFLVSKYSKLLSNKGSMKRLAIDLGVQVIPNTENLWPKIIKPADGFGSRGIHLVRRLSDMEGIDYLSDGYIFEDFIDGIESSVDVYFSKSKELHSAIARDRIMVEGGEVVHTRTRNPNSFELDAIFKFCCYGLVGPINFQFISSGSKKYLMEVNPRFSGGSTASIRAGWEAWKWILEEYVLKTPLSKPQIRHLELFRTRRDHWKFL
jgi:predicted ATP-grasp superfamily ATP-dependent carboligase